MTDRQAGKTDFSLHSSPWFPSGKPAEMYPPHSKYSYSVAGLTPSKYPIRVRSKFPNRKEAGVKFKDFPNIDTVTRAQSYFRDFFEYDFVRENEVLVTIEHCDQCQEHAEKTHHDATKYAAFAVHIKRTILTRYSMVKVLVKPLSALEGQAGRMGCFEVQVCSKIKTNVRKESLHSKLASLKWPDTEEVLAKLADFLPTCQLFVTVYDETASQSATLKGLKVVVRPKVEFVAPLDFGRTRPQSAFPTSARSLRPKSASSTLSRQSYLTARPSLKSPGLLSTRKKPQPDKKSYEALTDREGCCAFQNLPLDNYEIEVCESKEYAHAIQTLNTLEEGQGAVSFNKYVGVKPRGIATVSLQLLYSPMNSLVPNANVRLLTARSDIYPLPETSRGTYGLEVPHGEYTLIATAPGFQDIKKLLLIDHPDFAHSEVMKEKGQRRIIVNVSDVQTGVVLTGVHLKLRVNQSRLSDEGLTRQEGDYVFLCEDTGLISIEASKPQYLPAYLEQIVSHHHDFLINVGLVEVSTTESSIVVLHWNHHSDDVEFQVETPAGLQTYKNSETLYCQLRDNLRSSGVACAVVSPGCKAWVRLRICILADEYTTTEAFPSALQATGLTVSVYHNNKLLNTVTPPYLPGRYWEIGAVNASLGEFVEFNLVLPEKMQSYEDRINDFIEMAEYIRLSSAPLAVIFCFEQSGVLKSTETGREKVVSADILKRAFTSFVHFKRDDSADLLIAGLKNTQGTVSLSTVKRRYDRYKREGRNTLFKAQTIENYARLLGMEPMSDAEFLPLAEEGLRAPLPETWEAFYDARGDLKYRNRLTGDIVSDHPNDAIYREKFQAAKQLKREEEERKRVEEERIRAEEEKIRAEEEARRLAEAAIPPELKAFQATEAFLRVIDQQVLPTQLLNPDGDSRELADQAKDRVAQMNAIVENQTLSNELRDKAGELSDLLQAGIRRLYAQARQLKTME